VRTNQRNKRTIYYALYQGVTEVTDEYGYYTGEVYIRYSDPIKAKMNVSGGRGAADIEMFGIDNPYTRTAVTGDLTTPFDTDTIFWFEADPKTDTHNYRCTGVSRTPNQVVLALAEVNAEDDGGASSS